MAKIAIQKRQTKKCPFCREEILFEAIKCRFCGEFLENDVVNALFDEPQRTSPSSEEEREDYGVLFSARPSLWGMAGSFLKASVFLVIAGFVLLYPLEEWSGLNLSGAQAISISRYRPIVAIGIAVLVLLILLMKAVKLKCTRYEVSGDRIEWSRGILERQVDNLDMFRVIDLSLRRSLIECIFGIGTVILLTNDKSDPQFVFKNIHQPRLLYDILKKASLEADKRNQVVHLE